MLLILAYTALGHLGWLCVHTPAVSGQVPRTLLALYRPPVGCFTSVPGSLSFSARIPWVCSHAERNPRDREKLWKLPEFCTQSQSTVMSTGLQELKEVLRPSLSQG